MKAATSKKRSVIELTTFHIFERKIIMRATELHKQEAPPENRQGKNYFEFLFSKIMHG
jgi:hypothetical protein